MPGRRAAAALAALLPWAALAQGAAGAAPAPEAPGYVSCRDRSAAADRARRGAVRRHAPPAAASGARVPGELERAVRAFEEEARAFRSEVQGVVQEKLDGPRRFLVDQREQAIRELEALERGDREVAIGQLEQFLSRHPREPRHTPETMFRLAELYYEKANDEFALATAAHRDAAARALAEGREPPPEPLPAYGPSIALYRRLADTFPEDRRAPAARYLLAWCLAETGQGEQARSAYRTVVERHPESPLVAEAWMRLGDWHFDATAPGSLPRAAEAYARVAAMPAHPLYPRALYKLGWTYFRMDQLQRAVESFALLLDHDVASREAGKARGDVWPEAVQYVAISFADERWGGVERARAFFAARGGRPYEAEVFARLGDLYLEATKHARAVEAYRLALAADPVAPDAPDLQARIVLAWWRERRRDDEARERDVLVRAYAEGTPWWERYRDDPARLAAARALAEKSLLRAATFHHARAQALAAEAKPEAAAEYRTAARVYGDLLARVPGSQRAYEHAYHRADCLYHALEFEAAARLYAAVRDDPAADRFESDAALSAVMSREREISRLQATGALEVREVRPSTGGGGAGMVRPGPLPTAWADLVRDSDVLLARFPDHDKAPAIAYKAAEAFYVHGDLEESRCRLEEVIARWPATDVGRFAANLVVGSHLATKDWEAVERAAVRLQSADVAKDRSLRAELQRLKLGSRFELAVQRMQAREWDDAASRFLALVAEDPRHEFADEALYNAARCRESAGDLRAALALYDRLPVEHPQAALAGEALFRSAQIAGRTWDVEGAVERHLALVERYPGSPHRKDALREAARSLEDLQRYGAAAAAFARYARLYPDADDAPRAQFRAALLHGKAGDRRREIQALQEFVRRFPRTPEHALAVEAHLRIARARIELGEGEAARASCRAALAEFRRRRLRPEDHPRAAAAAAEARFLLAEHEFERYDRIALPATTSATKLQGALRTKLSRAKEVGAQYDEVMRFKRPDWILAAFYRKACVLERLARTIADAPVPPELRKRGREEYLAAYQDALARAAQPYEDQAVEVYVEASAAARRLHVKNEWTEKTAESLARYRPKEYPVLKEAKARLVVEDLSPSRHARRPW